MKTLTRQMLFVAFALLVAEAQAAYGLKWKPGDEEAVAGAYLTSESAFELRMRQPDGKIRKFWRDFAEPNMLYGEEPWVGEDMGNGLFRILTNPEFKGGRTGFVFEHGHLRRMVLGRKDYQFEPMPFPASTNSIESLWPKELTADEAGELFGTWKGEGGRMRLGYANPNKGGCLMAEIALLGLAALLLAGKRRRWLMATGAILAAVAFVLMVKTESRSALVALVAGTAIIVVMRAKALFTWRRLLALLAVVAVGVGVVVASGVASRFTSGLVDAQGESDALRVNIMKAAPQMMADASCGWGLGRSGSAYANWYQAPTELRVVRTLVNSHLTWLVEFGWVGRTLYVAGLLALMVWLLVMARRGASPLPAALFALLFVAGCFNSVMEAPTLWIVPVASLVFLFASAGRKAFTVRSAAICALFGLVIAGIAMAGVAYAGDKWRFAKGPALRSDGERVIVNGESAETWVADDGAVLGQAFVGRELRMFYAAFPQTPPMGIVWDLDRLPEKAKCLIVAGKRCVDFVGKFSDDPSVADGYGRIIFLSPPFAASSVPEALAARPGFRMMQGELAARFTPDAQNPPPFLKIIPGAELYIPGWMQLVEANAM